MGHELRFLWLLVVATLSRQLILARAEVTREFEISEGVPIGTSIGFIGELLQGSQQTPPPPPYLIVPVPGSSVDSDLTIDQSNGEIRTRIQLDRETRDLYSLVAIPINGENIRVIIRVKDENDNAPTFPSPYMSVEFPENTPRDVKRTLQPAKDKDLGIYNSQRYSISGGNVNNAFRLSSHRERDGVLYLDLQVNGFLDRETTPFYNLVIDAFDGGIPPMKGSMTVNVTIQDVNDNQPIFNQSRYFATVPENATVGTSVLQVFATDTDAGPNGQISYSINRRQTDKDSIFKIDINSGVISVNRPLDFESKEVHELVVVARDNGAQPLETTVFVSIRIIDVNDNQPVISLIFLTDDATPKVSEAAQPGEFVARISVHDPDSKQEYANINVTLEGGDEQFGLATRNSVVYLVIVSPLLDRETKANYTLTVIATDQGNPPLNTSTKFLLQIQDVNDNAPQFTQEEYHTSVLEVADPGTSVLQVVAIDADLSNNSFVSYELKSTPDSHSQWFDIDSNTGLITTKSHIDCETDPMPRLVVVASDHGKPPLSSSVTVFVRVKDINDNEPQFDHSFYNVSVAENTAIGRCILKVSASDPDCGVNAMVTYTIRENSAKPLVFTVNSTSGEICVSGPLDFEERSVYEIPLVATDTGGLSSTTMVKIQVIDTNDNRPIFYPLKYNISLREGVVPSGPIVSVAAVDKDSGKFGQITYAIVKGNEAGYFQVNKQTGEITVNRALTKTSPFYSLTISATDGSGLVSEKNADLMISMVDAKQQPPVFQQARYSFTIEENAPPNSIVGSVSASGGGRVRYSISSGDPNSYFVIDTYSGTIKMENNLDHEKVSSVLLNIQATSDEPPAYSHCQVDIQILDVNDNVPKFELQEVSIWVPENTEIGSVIYGAYAEDADDGDNGMVSYSLLESPSKIFKLDSRGGQITLQEALDYENVKRYTLIIGAQDYGSPPRVAQNLTLFIEIQDVNDNAPSYDQQRYIISASESLPVNSHIAEVHATDEDTGNNARISYSLQEPQLQKLFGVFPNSGILYLKSSLDRETVDNYLIRITAIDHGTPPLSATTVVSLRIQDENDNAPEFPQSIFQFTIQENNEPGTNVGYAVAEDKDIGENGAIRYSLQPAHSYFQIDPNTGALSATSALDREKQWMYEIQVVASDQGSPQKQSEAIVKINVTDMNDNSPTIIEPTEDLLIVREEQPGGTEVTRIVATDPDNGQNATVVFSLVSDGYSDAEDFTIDAVTGVVRTRNVLDHEKKSFYTLGVIVRDKGIPPLESVHEYRIEVVDLNDNRPLWVRSKFSFKLYENATVGKLVGTVTATDEDSGDNGRITYIIIHGNTHDSFDIDKTSGGLLVAKELNYEITSHYLLQVKAVDNSDMNPQSNFISVEIDILDVNDERPRFPEDPVVFSVPENARVGSDVWNFTAIDGDDGLNGILYYTIVQQQPPGKFRINMLTGTLYLQAPLDYETHSSHIIVVAATDQALNPSERLNATVTAHIIIEDQNDNPPVFTSSPKISVYEIEPANSVLHTVIATDLDSRENGRITYTITSGNDVGCFQLNSDNGQLSLVKPLDKEEFDYFSLNITASDQGSPPSFASQILQVTVEDVNNSPPQFVYRKYEGRVQENSLIGTEVLKVTAFERDQSPNNTLLYVIPEGMADGKFAIHPSTGSISVTGLIDRELQSEYVLTVYAHDGNYVSLFDTTTAVIKVADVNDNAPDFKDSCTDLYVPENSELGIIHTFTAIDPDTGRNGEVTFSILAGNLDNMFSVDLHSGKFTSRPLDRERRSHYQLLITAQDQGLPVQRTSCNMTIYVNDENDCDPMWTKPQYSASIPENVPIGTTVLSVEASDADIGINSVIKYSLNNESHWHFTIDNATGAIVTAGILDRENIKDYTFEVAATDGGLYDSRSSKAQVHIVVTDVNDNRPKFSQNPVLVEIPPHTKPGQKIVQLIATDTDEGINSDITYSMESQETKFRVQPQTGVITPVISLSSERGRIFQLKVVAKDQGTPALSSTALVVIQVGDVPLPNTVRFQESLYETEIPENSLAGTEMVQVTALRNDGRRQPILYSIVGGNEDNIFEIVSSTGLIRVGDGTNLDMERQPKFSLVVSAKTDNPVPLYAHVLVNVNLTDENDNVPRFTQDSYIASVWEGNSKGTFVTQVTATDNDEGPNANLIYHIVDGNHDNAFIIEPPFSGIVKTNIVLDREIQDKYRLTIIATDEGSPQMTGTCLLQINVIDINDNQPTFPPHSVINITENVPVGTLVTTMVANDVDTNPSLVYAFTENGNPNSVFSIGKYSGRITLAKPIDYEEEKSHTVDIQVSDSVHTAFTSLTVNIMDYNDNAPKFSQHIYHITIPDDTKPGSQVIQINATDKDSGRNAIIKYSLRVPKDVQSRGSRGLWIDENTGMIYTNGSLPHRHETPFAQLTVIATDTGKPKKSSKTALWIEVRPSESDLLHFTQSKYAAQLSEDTKPGTVVVKLGVEYDKKLSKNLHFHYAIISGNVKDYFTITSHTGEILVAQPLDREVQENFKLKVTVGCVNMAKCSSTAEISIQVTDVNDNAPTFNQTEYRISVSENKPVGSSLLRLQAIDADLLNDTVRYDITSGNDATVVELNPRNGNVVLKEAFDYDNVAQYRFVVRATDSKANGRFWSLAVVHVDVEDENDNQPQFPFPLYMEFVGENEPIGTTVFVARATDLDKGIYGKLNYSILEGDGKDKFHIEPTTGIVTTDTVFDYEVKNRYYFTLRAHDIGGQSSTVKVQIGIDSRDEFPPQFTQKTYKFIIPSNAAPGHVVGRVDAIDQDHGPDGRVIYQMRQQNGYFRVNRTNGAIILRQTLTNDLNASVVVMANSGRPGSRSAVAVAEISVGAPSDELEMASGSSVADWVVGLLVTSLLLLFLCCTVFVVLHLRHKKQSKSGKSETYNNSAFDTLEYAQSTMIANSNSRPTSLYGPQYSDLADLGVNERRRVNNTVSELSDQSHSASSGRGSAEDGEEVEDEEIRMINEGSLAQQKLRDSIGIPDSGIHGDDDTISQSSAKNTQEYLARLGIRPKLNDDHVHQSHMVHNEWTPNTGPDALDSIHLFEDDADRDGDGDGMDISTLIYAQIPDDVNDSDMMDDSRGVLSSTHQPSMNGSLSSIVHSEEELTGSYNWDYLLDWGPQYQPLAHVFSEIARLKDDASNSSEAHYSGIHNRHTPSNQSSGKCGGPPPLLTNVAPRPSNSGGPNSARPGPLPPLPILPRSPISHDSTFSCGPMSPSFSPALSPLANRSPSISPLGNVGPNLIRTSQFHQNYSSSDSEMRI